ncbi:type II toxin-antitoxin system VapC family toxin [Candidatus Microgenomates bacterium]|nr:type II toxin-antitoxin system VapC family toxin [Candidatus Microgenomates bacterium]
MKYIVDSDFLIAFTNSEDSNHSKSIKIYKHLKDKAELVVLNLVFQESTTVVSKKFGMQMARVFYEKLTKFINTEIKIDEKLEREAWKVFLKQNKKGTSFVDCANLATHKKYKFDGILSFDKFYPKDKLVHT